MTWMSKIYEYRGEEDNTHIQTFWKRPLHQLGTLSARGTAPWHNQLDKVHSDPDAFFFSGSWVSLAVLC